MAQPGTIAALVAHHADRQGDAPAILAPDRPPLSYAMLWAQMRRTAQALADAGLGRTVRIGLCMPNGPEMAVALLSVMSCATCVPINPDHDDAALRALIQRLRVDALIVTEATAARVRHVVRELSLPCLRLEFALGDPAGAHVIRGGGAKAVALGETCSDDVAVVLHTSGTTGMPKVVPLTQRSQVDEALHRVELFRLDSRDRAICVAPLFAASALRRTLFPVIAAGGSIVCPPSFDGEALFDWLSDFKPTFYAAGPAVHRALLEAIVRRGRRPVHALRYIISGTTALEGGLQARFEDAIGAPVIQTYAMTEAGGIAQNPLPPGNRRAGSVGFASRGEISILRDDGNFAAAQDAGEIVVRGPQVFGGYENDAQANANAFHGEWFRTGDMGYKDEDGYLYITGRVKELINRGGFKVSPAEVDAALSRHPAVADVATFGVPHPSLGEDVVAAVVAHAGAVVTAQELRDFAFANVTDYKVPSRVLLVAAIPRTPNGKARRRELGHALGLDERPAYASPVDERERSIADAFGDVLKLDAVGRFDNFFALGGDSLRSSQVAARVSRLYGCNVSGATLFRRPTVAEFAAEVVRVMRDHGALVPPPIVPLPRGSRP